MKKKFGRGTVEVYRVYSGGGQGYDPSGRYYGTGLPVYSVTYEDDERNPYTGERGRHLTVEVRARSIKEAIEAAGDEITRRLHMPRSEWGRAGTAAEGPVVADFNTLEDLVQHAADQLGATHAVIDGAHTKLYFPRSGGLYPYEEASVWRKADYWHAQGPHARVGVSHLPRGAQPIGRAAHQGHRAAELTYQPHEASGFRVQKFYLVDRVTGATMGGPFDTHREAAGAKRSMRFGSDLYIWQAKQAHPHARGRAAESPRRWEDVPYEELLSMAYSHHWSPERQAAQAELERRRSAKQEPPERHSWKPRAREARHHRRRR